MRFLSLFFAFYFACLSCLTCADEVTVCKDQRQITVAAASHADCGANALGDWCSPLCQCHCCGGAVVPVAFGTAAEFPRPVEWASSLSHGQMLVGTPTQTAADVWQPPQA